MTGNGVVFICSDAVGETAEHVVRSALEQFETLQVRLKRFSHVKGEAEVRELLEAARREDALVAYTLVQPELRETMREESARIGVRTVDVIGPMMEAVVQAFHGIPMRKAGAGNRMGSDYYKRIEALEFAVRCDDGRDASGMLQADIVLLGVSRTSKTPLSIFLAHKGFKTANFPIVPEVKAPKELLAVERSKLFGLTMSPEQLIRIRTERLRAVGLPSGAQYAAEERVADELAYAQELMGRLGCPVLDVTNRAIEETAGLILAYRGE